MSSTPYRVELLAGHDRRAFASASPALNRYFHEQVGQDVRRRVASCFVVVDQHAHEVAGFYTLASAGIAFSGLPAVIARKLPRYPSLPAVRLGRLAVAVTHQGQGLGAALLADTLQRAVRAEIAAHAMLADAKGESAAAFYRHHGFIALPDNPLSLFLPLAAVGRLAD